MKTNLLVTLKVMILIITEPDATRSHRKTRRQSSPTMSEDLKIFNKMSTQIYPRIFIKAKGALKKIGQGGGGVRGGYFFLEERGVQKILKGTRKH